MPYSKFTAELLDTTDPEIGQERIRVNFDDGRTEEVRLHEYERLYALPGVYEAIVHDQLGCTSPATFARMLAGAVDRLGWRREEVRVLDLAAGNGISGQALRDERLTPVLGTDIVPEARAAAVRDRPKVYPEYLTLDLLELSAADREHLRGLRANAVNCVAPVTERANALPPEALAAAAALLEPDGLVAYMFIPDIGPDVIDAGFWSRTLGPDTRAELVERHHYLHRHTVSGGVYEMERVLWRLRRPDGH
jgi:hypothetical protein